MIGNKTVLALIPARGGSKGVPRKNVRPVAGRPLIAWSIEAAREARYVDRVVLSSDDEEIIAVARDCGCEIPFVRPADLATDVADSMQVVRHALAALPKVYDIVVLLQPTSPMRQASDIDAAIEIFAGSGATTCVSVCEPDKSPYWMLKADADGFVGTLFPADQIPDRRQDAPRVSALNGAIYVATTEHIAKGGTFLSSRTAVYDMPKERSFDIDTELDLQIVDFLMTKGRR